MTGSFFCEIRGDRVGFEYDIENSLLQLVIYEDCGEIYGEEIKEIYRLGIDKDELHELVNVCIASLKNIEEDKLKKRGRSKKKG
jgi:hypothetical protein